MNHPHPITGNDLIEAARVLGEVRLQIQAAHEELGAVRDAIHGAQIILRRIALSTRHAAGGLTHAS